MREEAAMTEEGNDEWKVVSYASRRHVAFDFAVASLQLSFMSLLM